MKFFADLHIHSKYSRAVSKSMVLEELDRWADDKGILVMGTGDFTHPAWFKELKQKLELAEPGLFKLKKKFKLKTIKGTFAETRFMLTVEISCIYTRGGRGRRVHHIVFAPDIETAEKINTQLSWIGNLASDGRPIIGLDSEELAKIVFNANPRAVIVPAHVWTPWFSVFGSMSGFDSLEECFGEYAKNIFAIETGLSSDPQMNWRVKSLDKIALISNSDSHSLQRIGREANVFDTELSYSGIMDAIKSRNPKKFLNTIEFFPEEGKYHYDGHRACGVVMPPKESKKLKDICPKCEKKMTLGVVYRVDQLADSKRPEGYQDPKRVPYKNLVTLDSIIGEALDVGKAAKSVMKEYEKLIKNFKSEFNILLNASVKEIALASKPEIAEGVARVRGGKLTIKPGYDGEFGVIKIFSDEDRKKIGS
ncbi:MAG: DNA helicase UvrD [Candidatus Harrisonbacteria bacterium RIFCSPLOWO2_02_FULL_41_11]|uniref:DNA helicase UvrD n=1 Tax=Candidatus Harrisonbacteria bacterium RIFCSPHIGHO2_02_FULL_42_16 TaxID=1798404 RepID=A0A1G1ZI79_9BACT|nr:MAG: DNA helicase UvrD [Candidatus Harrisonbacteria bacterium RIFCSPHIGHO2_02_FULL_42_16]OGY67155.1 MAG: DNA helicase UvrD [Candidatus Harrisonbacteria bacterium RIFCSPLOWO2_02_FULL_41_11]